ncbi:TolC family protein [Sphingomonas bacterium]|uniref:TolC family protein n=1 Tax=Sphingomonas bacterium TaxID=1895847 RepID=UPI0015754FF1|nr:TolC family protein [Sphingomonas bacterium]
MRGLALLPAVALLSGCATYRASPLGSADAVLAPSDPAIVSVDAARIDRPYLTAQPIDLSQPLTPNALAVLAVLENPDLKALRMKGGVTSAQAFAARLIPDPTAAGTFDKRISGPDPLNGFGGQIGFDLGQLRLARATRAAGKASKRQVRLDYAWAEWQAAGQARLLGVRILALTQQAGIARFSAAAAERLFQAVGRAAGRGDLAAGDLDARRQAALDSADKARAAERDLTAARGELSKLLGLPPETMLILAPAGPAPVPPAASVLTAQAIDRRLDLQALRQGYAASEADLHKQVLDQFPNLSLQLAGARDTAGNYTTGPTVGFALPLWNRNRGGIAVATATRAQLKAEYDARLFQTRADIGTAVAALTVVRRQRGALVDQLPTLRQYADATKRAADRGDLAPATADAAAQAIRDRQLTLSQLDQQIAEQTIALELLSGGPSEGWTR